MLDMKFIPNGISENELHNMNAIHMHTCNECNSFLEWIEKISLVHTMKVVQSCIAGSIALSVLDVTLLKLSLLCLYEIETACMLYILS